MSTVHIVRTGTANLASVRAAFVRQKREVVITSDPGMVENAPALVLPGVGAFAPAMGELQSAGLVGPLQRRLFAGRPTLCICLGCQLLAESSEESPGHAGLGIFSSRVRRFTGDVRIPQMGWNTVLPSPGCRLLTPGVVYFANSFRLDHSQLPTGWVGATTEYAGTFLAAAERGPILACQFHPELSGDYGHALLARWLALAEASTCS